MRRTLIQFMFRSRLRDTDLDWRMIGESEPYFGVLTAEQFKRKNLDDDARAAFFQSGKGDVEHFIDRMRTLFGPFDPQSVLDFGCGVGRLTLPLAELAGTATGVDISPGMLSEARKHRHAGLRFLDRIPEELFDWVVSAIVLQHIPPERGYLLIDDLVNRVASGGGLTIQIMFGRTSLHEKSAGARLVIDTPAVRPAIGRVKLKHIPKGRMIMHDYDLSQVVGILYLAGIKNVHLEHCDHGGMIGATIYARR